MNGPAWTPAEDATLRESWGRLKPHAIAAQLPGRSVYAVRCRGAVLGLTRDRRLSDEDRATIIRLYADHTVAEVAAGQAATADAGTERRHGR